MIPLYWTNEWVYGSWMCKVMKGTLEVGSLMSSGFFQLIAVERYFLIVYTFNVDKVNTIGMNNSWRGIPALTVFSLKAKSFEALYFASKNFKTPIFSKNNWLPLFHLFHYFHLWRLMTIIFLQISSIKVPFVL